MNKDYQQQNVYNNETTPPKKKSVSFSQQENFKSNPS